MLGYLEKGEYALRDVYDYSKRDNVAFILLTEDEVRKFDMFEEALKVKDDYYSNMLREKIFIRERAK